MQVNYTLSLYPLKKDSVKVVKLYSGFWAEYKTSHFQHGIYFNKSSTAFVCVFDLFFLLIVFSRVEGLLNISCEFLYIFSLYSLKITKSHKMFPYKTILHRKNVHVFASQKTSEIQLQHSLHTIPFPG